MQIFTSHDRYWLAVALRRLGAYGLHTELLLQLDRLSVFLKVLDLTSTAVIILLGRQGDSFREVGRHIARRTVSTSVDDTLRIELAPRRTESPTFIINRLSPHS